MLGEQAWNAVSDPIHLDGVQQGCGHGSVQATHSNLGKPCLYLPYFVHRHFHTGTHLSLLVPMKEFLMHTKTFQIVVCFQFCGRSLGKNHIYPYGDVSGSTNFRPTFKPTKVGTPFRSSHLQFLKHLLYEMLQMLELELVQGDYICM